MAEAASKSSSASSDSARASSRDTDNAQVSDPPPSCYTFPSLTLDVCCAGRGVLTFECCCGGHVVLEEIPAVQAA
jgi:hypothetical protein